MNNKKRILVVEDDALIALDLEYELADRGFVPVCAMSVKGAKRILEIETPSFAILDMHLKSDTTFDLADELRTKEIPFIFLSGNDARSLPDHLKSSEVLSKPVRMEEVVEKIIAIDGKQ